jgi:pimeloyl-ACP methyl ester carboxylesterase
MIKSAAVLFLLTLSLGDVRAQARVPRFEAGECLVPTNGWPDTVRVECGYLTVAESRERLNGPTVRLPVALFRAKNPDGGPPLVMLHGGPGGNGGLQSSFVQQTATWPLAGRRDIVIYDQRGAGLSEPRVCPNAVERNDLPLPERVRTFLTDCVALLRAAGRDPSAYSTQENAADAIELRKVLGYATWDIYGVSYGSRLAQELMRQDGKAIRSVVLTGVVPPGPRPYLEVRLRVQEAFHRLFSRCERQSACAEAFPTLAPDFYETYEALTREPMTVQVPGAASPVRLDGVRFVEGLRRQINAPNLLPRVPILIRELHHGDRTRAGQLLMTGSSDGGPTGTSLLVSIGDVCGSKTLSRDADAVTTRVAPAFRDIRTLSQVVEACAAWGDRLAGEASFAPVVSDVPTLIVSAEFDDRMPAEYGRAVAASLKTSYQFEVPREAHGQLTPGCHTSIVIQFLENPFREPDGACLQTMPTLAFETTAAGNTQKFTFTISAEATPGNRFAGSWEAILPGAFGVTAIDLKIEGAKVTGTISQPRASVNVFDGRIEGAEMIFKATSGDGDRTIILRGTLGGDELTLTRELVVRPGGFPGTQGIFGASGPPVIVANRVQ